MNGFLKSSKIKIYENGISVFNYGYKIEYNTLCIVWCILIQKIFAVYLKFMFNWEFYIFSFIVYAIIVV